MQAATILTLGPPAMLGVTVASLLAIRNRSPRMRLAVEGLLLLALSGGFVLWGASPLAANVGAGRPGDILWLRALAVVWWLMGARFLASLMALALGRDARSRQARLLSDLVAAAIYLTAALVVLNSVLGLQLKGLVATSGVIAVLLGLASQSTLADVFSGIALGIDQSFRVGDRVSIFDHAEGVIVQMNWRSIRVQTDGDDIAMIPNSIVAKSQIINHSVPSPRRAASVDIPVQSTERSELLIDLIRQAFLLSPAILAEPAPSASLKYLGARSITFSASYFVASSSDLGTARSQLLRRVRHLFRHAGVGAEQAPSRGWLLSRVMLFESLTGEQIDRLENELIPRKLDAGALLYEEGRVGDSIFIVRSGVLEIGRQFGDRVYGRIGPGEITGEISMMSGNPHPATVKALTACEVMELPRTALEKLLKEDHALGEAMEQSAQRVSALVEREDSEHDSHPMDEDSSLLGQIRQFLRRQLAIPADQAT